MGQFFQTDPLPEFQLDSFTIELRFEPIYGDPQKHPASLFLAQKRCCAYTAGGVPAGGRPPDSREAGKPAAYRLVQAARSVQQNLVAYARAACPRRGGALERKPRAGCCVRGASLGCESDDRDA